METMADCRYCPGSVVESWRWYLRGQGEGVASSRLVAGLHWSPCLHAPRIGTGLLHHRARCFFSSVLSSLRGDSPRDEHLVVLSLNSTKQMALAFLASLSLSRVALLPSPPTHGLVSPHPSPYHRHLSDADLTCYPLAELSMDSPKPLG